MFETLLIANRGEIACRIARTARAMGIRTAAVYSEADAGALHVAECDDAFPIGPAPAAESYLRIDALVAAARAAGADAAHPGYGFLSENAAFARACAEAGLVFVGPSPDAIEAMGSKAGAKALMARAGVPLTPGYHGEDQSEEALAAAADGIGYPVLLKASAGGGGRGMRMVESPDRLGGAIESARREATRAFGDGRLLVEKYLARARHVEVQVFGDAHGNVVHLFERDCSVQRRHQKVLEEAPAPGLAPEVRAALAGAAVAAARAIGYVGAGTVEFILDGSGFYFMEMNTRLQVEHPVTEAITGLDLVEWQLRVAAGEPLPLRQEEIALSGHAFEARLYAEDPARFRPRTGRIARLRLPGGAARVDAGVREGDAVTPYYDPMIAKIVVRGRDRAAALARLRAALRETRVAGLVTNQPFLARAAAHPAFAAGEVHTGFIEEHAADLLREPAPAGPAELALAALAVLRERQGAAAARDGGDPASPWRAASGWRLNGPALHRVELEADGERRRVVLEARGDGWETVAPEPGWRLSAGAGPEGALRAAPPEGAEGRPVSAVAALHGAAVTLFLPDGPMAIGIVDPLEAAEGRDDPAGRLSAPMPGRIVRVHVAAGAAVARGEPLVVLEAMKMEHTIAAPADGRVAAVHYAAGDLVEEGADLLDFEAADG